MDGLAFSIGWRWLEMSLSVEVTVDERIAWLYARRAHVIIDMKYKMEEADWHGVQDAASDIRDIESEITGLERAKQEQK